jgi:DNA invertase Pin-like site-specific DNA recombinase
MALRSKIELEQENQPYIVTLVTTKLLLIYARQSSSRQFVHNIYSAMEQRDGLIERAHELGWIRDDQYILYVENQLAKKTQISGSLRIDQRPGLKALTEVIESGKASAVLIVSVDRLTRDEDLITPTQFANLCKKHHVVIIVTEDEYTYDFNNPNSDDIGKFMNAAIAAKEYIRKQIKGKALKGRTRKVNMGRVGNGTAPIGLQLDESRNNLVPSVHRYRVNDLYKRYHDLNANLNALYREIVNMAQRGEPLFYPDPSINESTIYASRMEDSKGNLLGWTIKSRTALKHLLSNPMYAGHLSWNGKITKYNAHTAIVEPDLWLYCFEHISKYDLDNNPIERPVIATRRNNAKVTRTARYTQKNSQENTALLAGTRDNGLPVIDGVGGSHVYVQPANSGTTIVYTLRNLHKHTTDGYETSIAASILDRIIANRILVFVRGTRAHVKQALDNTASQVEQPQAPLSATSAIDGDLALTIKDLASVQRVLKFPDLLSDERLAESLASEKRLIKRKAELEHAKANEERIASQRTQATQDLEKGPDKWSSWDLEKRRSFIRLVTDTITLEKIDNNTLRVTIVWSPLIGFLTNIVPTGSDWRAIEVGIIQRKPEQATWKHTAGTRKDNYGS